MNGNNQQKARYEKPGVVVFGTLGALTQAVAMNSTRMDGGVGQTDKTA
jgi:hypothetical protein